MLNELETTEEKFPYIFIFEVSPGPSVGVCLWVTRGPTVGLRLWVTRSPTVIQFKN